ncbi:MAG: hypothetical protein NC418_06595 [Muribaculaceae bacterium]|nr:hypothetical protein [Muribaculaceae bacterium]
MSLLKRITAALALSISTIMLTHGAEPTFKVPDFAYPQTVATDARAALAAADRTGGDNGAIRLRALQELCAAQSAIDRDSAFSQPALVERQLAAPGLGNASKAMMLTYEARLLTSIYSAQAYKYNRVEAPLIPYPADIAEWSAEQFRTRTFALLDSAAALADSTPLSSYADCLDYSAEAITYLPTVADFVRYCTLRTYSDYTYGPRNYRADMEALCRSGIESAKVASAPYFYWTVRAAVTGSSPYPLLAELYSRYDSVEAARYVLQAMTEYADSAPDCSDRLVPLLRKSLEAFPKWYDNASLSNSLASITRPRAEVALPSMVAPDKAFTIDINYDYAKSVTVDIYSVPATLKNYNATAIAGKMPRVASVKIDTDKTHGKASQSVSVSKPGRYAAVLSVDGKVATGYTPTFDASPLMAFALYGCRTAATAAVDFTTGAPLKGVAVKSHSSARGKETSSSLGRTDAAGLLAFEAPVESGYANRWLSFGYKGGTYDLNKQVATGSFHAVDDSTATDEVLIFTSRQLYHPGDSIDWAVVAGSKVPRDKEGSVLSGRKLDIKFYNANGELTDSASAVTDAMGRAFGSFATRKGVLTGDYRIAVDGGARLSAMTYVTVSDFKAPVFEVTVDAVRRDVPAKGCVTIDGTATTYSGVPVADAKVSALLRGAMRWRWFMPAETIGTVEGSTDAEGHFSIVFDAAMLERDKAYHDFIARITVTNRAADTAEASRTFTTGKPYTLTAEIPESFNADKPFSLNVEAYDADGKQGTIAYTWRITDAAKTTGLPSGTGTTGTPVSIDLGSLAAGDYSFRIAAADTLLAVPIGEDMLNEMQLYSVRRNAVPASVEGYMLTSGKAAVAGGSVKITVGTNADDLYLYAFVRNDSELLPAKMHHLRKGFSTVKIDVPGEVDKSSLHLVAVRKGKVYTEQIELEKAAPAVTEIIAESFRDRLTPGRGETWRFRLASGKSAIKDAGMIATMYNRSLDALQAGRWPSAFYFSTPGYHLYVSNPGVYFAKRSMVLPFKFDTEYTMNWPLFKFLNTESGMYIRGTSRMYKAAASAGRNLMTDLTEKVESEEAVVEDSAMAGMAPGISTDGGESSAAPEESFEYREAEVLQALWQPALVSDAKGNIDVVFTVPNANTTWQFKAFGWSKALATASYAARAVASKPVMVQPTLPRFLRSGDSATVLATVYNKLDNEQIVTTTVEIFDIESGAVTATASVTDTIAPMGSAIVAMPVVAAADAAAIGYRVRSSAAGYADGEQAAIPVLSSAASVIESTEFYLNPTDEKPFVLNITPKADATLTLQYCQNPVWTVVKAMRGIAGSESITSTGIASRLFSALAARHITTSNPQIAEAIRTWRENPSEDALTSMLERNEDLKQLLLEQTPWVQAARSNSARMTALAELLDSTRAEKAIADASAALAKMQTADGGFRWGSWSNDASEWCTVSVLTTMGIARSLGLADSSFDAMLEKAFVYLQKQAVKPGRPATDRDLALIAALFPGFKKTVGAGVINATVADIAAKWKADGTLAKAYDVLILAANARKAEAAKVLTSIRQFGVVKPGMGLCFPNVSDMRAYATIIQAYATMDAPKAEIDAMRQWVIVQAQALDDLGAYNPDYIIAAVLLTGSDWTSAPVDNRVTVNGAPLAIDNSESASGYFSQTIPTDGRKLTISIAPNGVTPSYGSVTSIGKEAAKSVKARPGKDLAIEKRFMVERDGQWVATDRFTLGERVRVQLTIKAKRNLEYVSIADERAATLAPVDQLPGYVWDGALSFYRENLDASTRLFISYLPKGTYHIAYDMTAALEGSFISGIATLQSQYAPELTAHSAGTTINVEHK